MYLWILFAYLDATIYMEVWCQTSYEFVATYEVGAFVPV
jgi:hypothetical protein